MRHAQQAYSKIPKVSQKKVGQVTKRKQIPVLDTGTGFRLRVKHPGSPLHVAQLMADVQLTPFLYSGGLLQLPYVHALTHLWLYPCMMS